MNTAIRAFRIVSICAISLAVLSFAGYYIAGTKVDEAGFLHELFFLIPVGYLLAAMAIISMIISIILHVKRIKSKKS